MKQQYTKADAVRMLWFELLSDYPVPFKLKQMVDGQMADFYSEQAGIAIFVDACDTSPENSKTSVQKIYLTSAKIRKNPIRIYSEIECCIKAAQLYRESSLLKIK